MNYSDLNLKINTNTKVVSIQPGVDIEVLQYLPIEDKDSIVSVALQNADENGTYNLFKIDMFFNMYIVYMYSNLEFTNEEKIDPTLLYNTLKSNGILDAIVRSIPEEEYGYLFSKLTATLEQHEKYRSTIASVLNSFVENLPINANAAKDIIEKFNPEDFTNVMNFVNAANGGRPLN
jgi:hypothetical protein